MWRGKAMHSHGNTISASGELFFNQIALGYLLEDLDYEADKTSGGAVAARVLAALITGADEMTAKASQ